jgi:hypothetical protein
MFLLRDKDILFLEERLRNYLGKYCNLGNNLGNIWDSIAT